MTTTRAACGRFAAGFFEPIGEHGFGVIGRPLIGQHLVETRVVVVQAEQQLTQIGPRFDAVALGTGEDREQDGRSRPGLRAAQEQPVLAPDRLVTQRSLADIVVDRYPTQVRAIICFSRNCADHDDLIVV